jgi:hypothetical protein
VPVEGEAAETQIGDDEVSVPITEEEVRIHKDVVEDTEAVEEVDVEDQTGRRNG